MRPGTIDFIDAVLRGSSDVALVDPLLAGRDCEIAESLSRAHLGTVLYIHLTPEYAQAAVGMIRQVGSGEVVTYGYNDDPTTFAAILRRQSRASRGQLLLRALAPQIANLPPEVRAGVHSMSEYGDRIDSVDCLASVCGVTRSTLWRHLRSAGVASAWGFVTGIKMLRNYDALVDASNGPVAIARAVGVSSTRALQHRCKAVVGLTLQEIRKPISIEELASRIADVLTTPRPETAATSDELAHAQAAELAHGYSE
ncbi:MAG: hypothetical protein ABI311_00955 [Gemmatimonadaceae bacterium]